MTETTKRVPCEVYSRIVGYLRPIQNWNEGKIQEWKDRKTYKAEVRPEKKWSSDKGTRAI